jgi:phosphate starvation-inducible membrane PsiE
VSGAVLCCYFVTARLQQWRHRPEWQERKIARGKLAMLEKKQKVLEQLHNIGDIIVEFLHYLALLVIGGTVLWSAAYEYLQIIDQGHPGLKDILLLFIYLELGAMVGIYFKTHRLPVEFLIYIAVTALARHLVIDIHGVTEPFHLYLIVALCVAILILSLSILAFAYTAHRFGRPEDPAEPPRSGP